MVYNEFNKKKCRHLDEVNQAQNSLTDACDRPFSRPVMAVVFFIGTLVSAWRVAVADGGDIWYVPVIMALASAAMTVGALQHGKGKLPKIRIDMKTNLMQLLRLVLMVLAVAASSMPSNSWSAASPCGSGLRCSVSGSWACSIRSA